MNAVRYLANRIYTTWCCTWFVLPFVVSYPFQAVLLRKEKWWHRVHNINRGWSTIFLSMFLAPLTVEWRMKFDPKQRYIFTANHSSYLDIPMMLHAIPGFLNFVGKSSLAKVPLWGKVYDTLYITVDRKNAVSSARSYLKSKRTLDQGRNLAIFPEGTIPKTAGEKLMEFKDGPFKLAIEKQLPVVPITMPYNQHFMPDLDGKLKIRWHPLKIIIHEPIETTGLTLADLPQLKEQVFQIIQSELNKHTKAHVNRYSDHPQNSALSEA